MKRLASMTLATLLTFCATVNSQENSNTGNTNNANSTTNANRSTNSNRRPRGPVFRATREQIIQAQTILRQRGFLEGTPTEGRLDDATRAGLRRYQQAESLRVTGTLNRATLEKMNITLTERQRAMPN
jgi:peptidoglycan hydrolase-like protein with peptidoglycan-binding domain